MEIKAISFNIRCANDINGNSIEERAPRLAKIISNYDADVIGFQECTPLWIEYINKYFCTTYEFFNKYRDGKGGLESTPLLWKKNKFNCLKSGYFWLSDTPEISGGWDSLGCNRICLYTLLQCKKSGEIFAFFNTHLGFGEENQIKSIKLISQYIDKFSTYPTFIVGDFNLIPFSKPYEKMIEKFIDVNELTIKDRRSTYHGYAQNNNYNEHIDYCFITSKIEPISFKIIDDLVDGKFPSDHYGLYIKLKV